jgi:uncharacterized SAM-binding protein YcdF (DUF218 family)
MFAFKQLIGTLSHPGVIALLVTLLGFLMRYLRRPRAANILFIFAAVFAWLMATPFVGNWLLAPLERQYPPLTTIPSQVRYVVVLGSSYTPRDGVPLTAAIDPTGLQRLVEGVRLHRLLPDSRLVVSGGVIPGADAPATGNALLAEALGVTGSAVVKLLSPLDTRQEAAAVSALTGSDTFLLVTSSSHMPRAMEYMRRAGGRPIAAPTGQRSSMGGFHPGSLLPNGDGLNMSEAAIHEYLGWLALHADVH